MSEPDYYLRHSKFAAAVINNYDGEEPFHLYLRKYFRINKKHGSRDRRAISALCYNYFRLGTGVTQKMRIEERIHLANAIIPGEISELDERIEEQSQVFDSSRIFPFSAELSSEIHEHAFNDSFLIQPMVFIRIRPGYESDVLEKLNRYNVPFTELSENNIGFENNIPLDSFFKLNKEVLIQDTSSQRVAEFFNYIRHGRTNQLKIWDACAGSGGKSILAMDHFANATLTVSDVRRSILNNLHQRFRQAGLKDYDWFITDLTASAHTIGEYDLIIVDAPCSGSGTWSRTPEQLLFFKEVGIASYARKQKSILQNSIGALKKNGYLLYITCSVFKKENEEIVDDFADKFPVKLVHQQYLNGYTNRADTLFGALFQLSE